MRPLALARSFLRLPIFGLDDIASVLGIIGGAKNLIGGQQGGSKNSNTYVPTGLGDADTAWQQILKQLMGGVGGAGEAITPELAQAFTSLLGIDRSGIVPAGQAAGAQYGALAGQAQGAGADLLGQGRDLGQAGSQLWQTALDPQNALRNQIQQQVVDASRAGTSARGIGMGGESAGIENKAVSDFLLNWNNNQLQRQALGLQGYGNAANQSGRQYAGGLTAGALAPEYTQQSAMAPFNAGVTAAGFPFQAASMYTGALSPLNQQYSGVLGNIIPYLNSGQGATNQAFGQQQTGMNNLTTGLQQFGSGSSYNPFAGIFNSAPTSSYAYGSTSPGIDYANLGGYGP